MDVVHIQPGRKYRARLDSREVAVKTICRHSSLSDMWLVQRADRVLDRPFYLRDKDFLQELTE